MAASMHLAINRAGKFLPGFLMNRQRIHISANRQRRPRPPALNGADHAGAANPGAVRDAKPSQLCGNNPSRAHLLKGQFRHAMDVTTNLDQPRLDGGGGILQMGGDIIGKGHGDSGN